MARKIAHAHPHSAKHSQHCTVICVKHSQCCTFIYTMHTQHCTVICVKHSQCCTFIYTKHTQHCRVKYVNQSTLCIYIHKIQSTLYSYRRKPYQRCTAIYTQDTSTLYIKREYRIFYLSHYVNSNIPPPPPPTPPNQ